jgi:hypothetical protein
LKEAKPKPGGFQCAFDKESADLSFFELTLNGSVVWVREEYDFGLFGLLSTPTPSVKTQYFLLRSI